MGTFDVELMRRIAEDWDARASAALDAIFRGPFLGIESIINQPEGNTTTMAATETSTASAVDTDEAPTRFAEVFAEARDYTEKVDLLARALDLIMDEGQVRELKEWKDNQLAVHPLSAFTSLQEMVNSGPAESMTHAKELAEEAGLDLPEEADNGTFEDQVKGAGAEGSDATVEPASVSASSSVKTPGDELDELANLSEADLHLLASLSDEDRDALRQLQS